MNIYDIVAESNTKFELVEFYIPGGAQQEFVSNERVTQLGMSGGIRFRPWGTNTNPWTYSSDNMRNLAVEAMQIFAPYVGSTAANRSPEEISASIVNYWRGPGAQEKANIQNMFSVIANAAPDDAPLLHNEALGIMLNSLQLSTNSAAYIARQNTPEPSEEPSEEPSDTQ